MKPVKLITFALLFGFILGAYLGNIALSPGEDDFQGMYFTSQIQGEADAEAYVRAELLLLYDQNRLNAEEILLRLKQLEQ